MKKQIKTLLSVLVVLMLAVTLSGCGSKVDSKLVGTWEFQDQDKYPIEAVFVFGEDGKGTQLLGESVTLFSYETKDSVLYITYEGDTDVFESPYSFEGDTLVIVDSFGDSMHYTRKVSE